MKRCPSCQQTYPDDAPDYCSNDGMRLVDEEAATYDPERTMMSSGLRGGGPIGPEDMPPAAPPAPPPPPLTPPSASAPQYQSPSASPGIKPPTGWEPPGAAAQPQQWQTPSGQPSQPAWQQPPPSPAQNWGGVPAPPPPPHAPYAQPQQPTHNAPYDAPYAPQAGVGKTRALAIAALTTGACAVTIMSMIAARFGKDFVLGSLLILAILGIGLGVTALILSLQKPQRFGGVPLAIAGLATGTAALVYYFTL
jgi:hypothetical protein